ncbi:MAG: helix-turn-helix transcriptional regulator [Anaerolineaceae bacterium]|nr:helix-turn-helix transcriptional regulator [Anaerolineaceae bacterium]
MDQVAIEKYLPLSEATYYIMLALVEPMHGYAIMQKVEAMGEGLVKLGPGTLYGVLSTLEKQNWIEKTAEEERRKYYQLTDLGHEVLERQYERVLMMVVNGKKILRGEK